MNTGAGIGYHTATAANIGVASLFFRSKGEKSLSGRQRRRHRP